MYILPFLFITINILLIVAGYIIRKNKLAHLIASYNPDEVLDKQGYIKWTTSNTFAMGFVGLISGVLLLLVPHLTMTVIVVYIILIGLLALVVVIGEKRYKKKKD
jgi:hypothetical protein